MAVERDDPYLRCRFVVDLGGGKTAAFQKVSGLALEIEVVEYRTGSDLLSRKLPGRPHYPNAVLRRGVTGSLGLYEWIAQVRDGDPGARRTVRIVLLNEVQTPVMSWVLRHAWPTKYEGPTLNGTANDVAIEELVLCYDGLEVE